MKSQFITTGRAILSILLTSALCACSSASIENLAEDLGKPEVHTGRVVHLESYVSSTEVFGLCGRGWNYAEFAKLDWRGCSGSKLAWDLRNRASQTCQGYRMHSIHTHDVTTSFPGGPVLLKYSDFASVNVDCPENTLSSAAKR